MATPSSQQTLSTFRHILREVNIQFTKPSQNPLYKNELKQAYLRNRTATDPVALKGLHKDAEDVLNFLTSSRKHKELLALYNPGLMDQQRRIELSAKRVGLQLPVEYDSVVAAAEEASGDESPFAFAARRRVEKAFQRDGKEGGR
ncbi:hypothetical protein BC938DRAFT_471747 [Jimgerdemannia flammicorona]|uniref:Complex 1 LYR protein n=1 Tax=Jimgerdemannia flammicorona TaxID=994334 RepID=A0A433Q7I3_9FUNG|nr:hypothetical protein BC938DRAFT_471747 [Jimgerdemannia flammicorona]